MLRVRRIIILALSAAPLIACRSVIRSNEELRSMYGLIGKIRSVPGQRDALASLLIQASSGMPGCLSYVVALDAAEADALWVTEVWDSSASHRASLSLPSVQQAITKAKPLIVGFGERFETKPIG